MTQNGSSTQFDVYFNPSTGEHLQGDLGATSNCYAIATNGDTLTTNLGDLPPGYELISSLLQAYKASAADLGGYTPAHCAHPWPPDPAGCAISPGLVTAAASSPGSLSGPAKIRAWPC